MKCSSVHGILIFAKYPSPAPVPVPTLPTIRNFPLTIPSCRSLANQFNVSHFAAKWEIFWNFIKNPLPPHTHHFPRSPALALFRFYRTYAARGNWLHRGTFPATRRRFSHLSESHLNVNFLRRRCMSMNSIQPSQAPRTSLVAGTGPPSYCVPARGKTNIVLKCWKAAKTHNSKILCYCQCEENTSGS